MKTTLSKAAQSVGASRQLLNAILYHGSKTSNIDLAVYAAKIKGGRPIDFISDRIRPLALKINPRLLNKKHKAIVRKKEKIVKR